MRGAALGLADVPEAGGAVRGGGGEPAAVGAEGDGDHLVLMAGQGAGCGAGVADVPQAGGVVAGGGGEPAAVGAEGDGSDDASWPARMRGAALGSLTSHRRAVLSSEAVASQRPSGLKATATDGSLMAGQDAGGGGGVG